MLDGEGARVIEDSKAGYVCAAGDAEALARKAEELADLGAAGRLEMGLRGREYCEVNFKRSTLLDQLERWLANPAA
jgi:glycosyltransferase involved in cell wall biosynthesis